MTYWVQGHRLEKLDPPYQFNSNQVIALFVFLHLDIARGVISWHKYNGRVNLKGPVSDPT